jgi:hypothetical protein
MMPFVKEIVVAIEKRGAEAFERRMPFEEKQVIAENIDFVRLSLGMAKVSLKSAQELQEEEEKVKAAAAIPGQPALAFSA